jgi:Leucine-rich repeat (LRR) protein
MGNKSSFMTSASQEKLQYALKTGTLNVCSMSLSPTSSIWPKLAEAEYLDKIKSLDMSDNKLKTIPPEVHSLMNLKTLKAVKCSLKNTSNLSCLSNLVNVAFSDNMLEVDSLGCLPSSLSKLDLSRNHFSGFPLILSNLVNLLEINLSFNRLESTLGIGILVNLREANFDNNFIVELSLDIQNLKNIKSISLKNNRIGKKAISHDGQSIPEAIFTESSLEKLDLSGNTALTKEDLLHFAGVSVFIERRKKNKDKHLQGGGYLDFSIFGLD